jgi:predicted phosphodiesterase
MKLAIISDIHGNMEAFGQVLADIDHLGIKKVICLGDLIGYGPEPEAVITTIKNRGIPSIMGNHDMAAIENKLLDWFNPVSRISLIRTLDLLSEKSLNFIRNLPLYKIAHGCRFVHGFPPDSITIYLLQVSENQLRQAFEQMDQNLCFVGHTHRLGIFGFDGRNISRSPLNKGIIRLNKDKKYIINTGSVGQPRDGNNNAKYLIWDREAHTIEARFIPYDIAATVRKIELAGLPEQNAIRLW